MVPYGAGGATGAPGTPEKAMGTPGSMMIDPLQETGPRNEQGCHCTCTSKVQLIGCRGQFKVYIPYTHPLYLASV